MRIVTSVASPRVPFFNQPQRQLRLDQWSESRVVANGTVISSRIAYPIPSLTARSELQYFPNGRPVGHIVVNNLHDFRSRVSGPHSCALLAPTDRMSHG
jgi:hypothetical protein